MNSIENFKNGHGFLHFCGLENVLLLLSRRTTLGSGYFDPFYKCQGKGGLCRQLGMPMVPPDKNRETFRCASNC